MELILNMGVIYFKLAMPYVVVLAELNEFRELLWLLTGGGILLI